MHEKIKIPIAFCQNHKFILTNICSENHVSIYILKSIIKKYSSRLNYYYVNFNLITTIFDLWFIIKHSYRIFLYTTAIPHRDFLWGFQN